MFYFFKKNKDNLKLRKLDSHTNKAWEWGRRYTKPKYIYLLNLDSRILPKLNHWAKMRDKHKSNKIGDTGVVL